MEQPTEAPGRVGTASSSACRSPTGIRVPATTSIGWQPRSLPDAEP
jgi:hypothetical protein